MVVGRGLMNISRINVNPTVTSLNISPSDLACDGYASFSVRVERADFMLPRPTGTIVIIDVDAGTSVSSGSLDDGYFISSKQLVNGAYNFAAVYSGIVNSFAPSQSTTVGYNVNFIGTTIDLSGPFEFRSDDGAEYIATVTGGIIIAPVHSVSGYVIFTANDGYQIITLDIVPLVSGEATVTISGGELAVGAWIIGAQFISDGVCYASSDIDSQNVFVR